MIFSITHTLFLSIFDHSHATGRGHDGRNACSLWAGRAQGARCRRDRQVACPSPCTGNGRATQAGGMPAPGAEGGQDVCLRE